MKCSMYACDSTEIVGKQIANESARALGVEPGEKQYCSQHFALAEMLYEESNKVYDRAEEEGRAVRTAGMHLAERPFTKPERIQ